MGFSPILPDNDINDRPRQDAQHVLRRLRMGMIAPLAVVATLLAGCSVGPDYAAPEIGLSPAWGFAGSDATATAAPELSEWWRSLGDSTLDALIEEAVAGSWDVETAKARVREARAAFRQAGGALLPSISASGSVDRSRNGLSSSRLGDRTREASTRVQGGFDASWELDLFGANQRGVEAAGYGMEAAEEALRAALVTLIGDVATNYTSARGYQARIALAERTVASQRETAALTRAKFEAGTVSALDVANATAQVSSTEANLASLRTGYAEALHRLGVLLGREPSALAARLAGDAPIPVPHSATPMGVPADVLLSRPDIRQAERELAQATARIGQAEAARYPSISLAGSISTSGSNFGDLARSSSISWSFGPSVSIPIFNGGSLAAAVDVAAAQRDQSYVAFQSAVLTALEEVENAAVGLAQARERRDRLEEAVAAYREAVRLARSLYQIGSSSFLDVLDAERSLYSAEDSLIQTQVDITTNYVALNKALGGGWSGEVDASRPLIVDAYSGPRLR